MRISRRVFVGALPFFLAGCASDGTTDGRPGVVRVAAGDGGLEDTDPRYRSMYGPMDDRFPVAAVDLRRIDPRFYRQQVRDTTGQPAGTIVVDPGNHFLYLVGGDGTAMRYGVGVGREGFGWNGTATIRRKAAWPTWTPPADMVRRDEKAAQWAGGMPGGPENPLGARALYLYQGNRDTLYRLHGTNEPASIGRSMSSGCIRLLNQDIIDLYERVPVGTRVVVLPSGGGTYADGASDPAEPDRRPRRDAPYEDPDAETRPGPMPDDDLYGYDPQTDEGGF